MFYKLKKNQIISFVAEGSEDLACARHGTIYSAIEKQLKGVDDSAIIQ